MFFTTSIRNENCMIAYSGQPISDLSIINNLLSQFLKLVADTMSITLFLLTDSQIILIATNGLAFIHLRPKTPAVNGKGIVNQIVRELSH